MPLARKTSSAGAALLLIGLIGVGCGRPPTTVTGAAGQLAPGTPTRTSTPATPTAAPDCSAPTETLSPPPQIPFALPPNTVSEFLGSASGAGIWGECTPNTSSDAIASFLNGELPREGWQRWGPQTQHTIGCAHPDDFWRWWKGDAAVGWSFTGPALPLWSLAFCNLAWGSHP